MNPKYINSLDKVSGLTAAQRRLLTPVTEQFEFLANEYYLSLINWDDPYDPIRRIIIPDVDELDQWGDMDPSSEESYFAAPGLQHKYNSTAVLLASDRCGGLCRFCFRKRLFIRHGHQVAEDVGPGLEYIRRHPEINNVLITGGDSLMLPTRKLDQIITRLRAIRHVRIIRLGTKLTAYNPWRIINDPALLRMIRRHSTPRSRLYLMLHFNHWREITDEAVRAVTLLTQAGAVLACQTPLIRGVNDNPRDLARLLNELSFIGVPPYYIFQCRPTVGNRGYAVPVELGYDIIEAARSRCSGLAKRARFAMSHAKGKIEVVGKGDGVVYFKFHRAADDGHSARFMVFRSNPEAYWFDDYTGMVTDQTLTFPEADDERQHRLYLM